MYGQGQGWGGGQQQQNYSGYSGQAGAGQQNYGGYPPPRPLPAPMQANPEQIFIQVDRDNSGFINAPELQNALSNGTNIPFNDETVRMMIALFDSQRRNQISKHDFYSLWDYINKWQNSFRSFDRDNSGMIDSAELANAFQQMGYSFSQAFVNQLMAKFDRQRKNQMAFDDFIQCCLSIQMLTRAFSSRDTNRTGQITLRYEEFLSMVFEIRMY